MAEFKYKIFMRVDTACEVEVEADSEEKAEEVLYETCWMWESDGTPKNITIIDEWTIDHTSECERI